jgi:hypothetical protein
MKKEMEERKTEDRKVTHKERDGGKRKKGNGRRRG